jgi:hypothetical protein
MARQALQSAQIATAGDLKLTAMKSEIAKVNLLSSIDMHSNDDHGHTHHSTGDYGLKQALEGAVSHISYAATSPDASENVKAFSVEFTTRAKNVMDRCDLITALSGDIEASKSLEEVNLLAPELRNLARANVHGEDLDGDGVVGSAPGEYGLIQLRRDIESMIGKEDPPYTTVQRWYLFNLIRLPDGSWKFRKTKSDTHYSNSGGY